MNIWLGLCVSRLLFPQPGDNRKGEISPPPPPEKNLGKEKLEGNEIIVFIIFVSCLLCLLCSLQTPNASFLCFFPVSFSIWKIQILYNHWRLQCSLPEKWIITQLSLLQLPQPSFAENLPGWNQERESLAHTAGTCPPSMNILHSLTPFQEAYYFCRSGLKATSESWVAPKISLKKKKKHGTSFTKSCSEPSRRGTKQSQNPSSHKGSIGSELLENGPGSRISLKSSKHLSLKDEQVRSRWQRYARMTALPGKMEGS